MLQKIFTEDFMTGKKSKNIGQRNRYYVRDSHPAIVSVEVFDKVQKEMAGRARLVYKEDGTVAPSISKYNGKYHLGNLLVCGDCNASYRRRTERGKVVWRCSTRIEKGKQQCSASPTRHEAWIRERLSELLCDGHYDEKIVRDKVKKIEVFDKYIIVRNKDGSHLKANI